MSAALDLFATPLQRKLPLSKGRDLYFRLVPKSPAVTWPVAIASAELVIDAEPAISIDGVITSSMVAFKIESEDADEIEAGLAWRVRLGFDTDTPQFNDVPVEGKTRRTSG